MRKLFAALCFALVLAFVATPASATIIDANYQWYATGGTKCLETGQIWGDISGQLIFKVQEYWVSGDERTNEPADQFPGHGMFKYDIHRLDRHGLIYDWKIYNPFQVTYLGTRTTDTASTWTAAHTAEYWYWSTTDAPINGHSGYFYIYTDAARGYVTADVSVYEGGNHTTFASGVVSGPVPEPTSMLLLGIGLIGLAGGKVRKRFMA